MQIGILGVLGIVFIVLKLVGVIAWSWWLVLLPLYAGFGIAFVVFLLTTIIVIGNIKKW